MSTGRREDFYYEMFVYVSTGRRGNYYFERFLYMLLMR